LLNDGLRQERTFARVLEKRALLKNGTNSGVHVSPPSAEAWRRIFKSVAAANGIEADDGQIRAIEHDLTVTQGLDLAAYQPRFLIEQIVASSRFKAQPPALHRELVQLALANLTVGRSPGGGDGVGMGSRSLARVA
jgi:hypothetical protein